MRDEMDRALDKNPDYPPGFGLWKLGEPEAEIEDEEVEVEDRE